MSTLAITRKTANTLITATGFNSNFAEIEAIVNALTADNLGADSVTAVKINSDVVRTDYGLLQHTDGSLYVDLSDTTPGLELIDGGLRIKSYGLAQRTANGLEIGRAGDLLLSSAASTPDGWTDVSATYEGKMIRVSATALSSGGSDTHTHTISLTSASGGAFDGYPRDSSFSGNTHFGGGDSWFTAAPAHTHTVSGTSASGDNVPAYMTTKMFLKS